MGILILSGESIMKKLLSILIISLLLIMACVTNMQNLESLSSSYDGIWEGYTDTPDGHFDINLEINNGIMSGYFEEIKIKGYVNTDNNLIIRNFTYYGTLVFLEANNMAPDRIEGTIRYLSEGAQWFVVRK